MTPPRLEESQVRNWNFAYIVHFSLVYDLEKGSAINVVCTYNSNIRREECHFRKIDVSVKVYYACLYSNPRAWTSNLHNFPFSHCSIAFYHPLPHSPIQIKRKQSRKILSRAEQES